MTVEELARELAKLPAGALVLVLTADDKYRSAVTVEPLESTVDGRPYAVVRITD